MIITKQMIKTNQILSIGWSVSIEKVQIKLWTNQQPALKRYVLCAIQSKNQQNPLLPNASFTLHLLITWTETFVRSKEFAK